MTPEQLITEVAGHLHSGQQIDGARLVADFSGTPRKIAEENPLEPLNGLFYWCLNAEKYEWGAKLLWTPTQFSPESRFTQLVWEGFRTSPSILLMGGASVSKSFSAGVWLMLDWLRDVEHTTVRVVGPSENHLKDNLFTHLVTLHQSASIPLPGIIGDLFIGLSTKARKSSIAGVVIPLGKAGSGKLQGTKRTPRKKPHPVFGPLTRLRIFIDELEKVPPGIFRDLDNTFANLEEIEGFKVAGAFNPENPGGPVGQRCEPIGGWEKNFDIETSEKWKSARGWDVIRLDPLKCENVTQGKIIYPGLQTKEGLERLILNAGGMNAPSYYTFARGCFPPQGTSFSIISSTALHGVQGEFIYQERPNKIASVDVALEGSNAPKVAVGRFGLAVGVKHPADHAHPNGREEIFSKPQWGLQMDQLFSLPSAETVRMSANIKHQCQQLGVDPGWVLLDRTGNGAGVHDLLMTTWSPEVRGVNYSESATELKIFQEDTKNCLEEYARVDSEMWFALQRWLEFKLVRISPVVDTERLFAQLTGRLYMPGKVRKVEGKRDYKSRGNESPDEADAFTLLLHCARLAARVIPSMEKLGTASIATRDEPVPVICGVTDRLDYL